MAVVCHAPSVLFHIYISLCSQRASKNSPLTTKTPKKKDFYELYAIRKIGAEKYCTSEDKSVFLSDLGCQESN